jgi:hypothetical protein
MDLLLVGFASDAMRRWAVGIGFDRDSCVNSFFLEIVEDTSGWSRYESQRNPQLIVNTRERRLHNAWGMRDARLSSAILDLTSHFGRRGAILYARDSRSVFGLPLRS